MFLGAGETSWVKGPPSQKLEKSRLKGLPSELFFPTKKPSSHRRGMDRSKQGLGKYEKGHRTFGRNVGCARERTTDFSRRGVNRVEWEGGGRSPCWKQPWLANHRKDKANLKNKKSSGGRCANLFHLQLKGKTNPAHGLSRKLIPNASSAQPISDIAAG